MTCLWCGRALCWKGQLWESFSFMTAGEGDVGSGVQRDNSWGQTQRLPLFLYLISPEFFLPSNRPSKSPPSGLTHYQSFIIQSLPQNLLAGYKAQWFWRILYNHTIASINCDYKLLNIQSFLLCLCLWPISTYSIFKVNPFNSLLISQRREFIA